jgi:hypothetical protein
MKTIALFSLLMSLTAPIAFAHNHEGGKAETCVCSKECKEKCSRGENKDCQCKACNCKEAKTCH